LDTFRRENPKMTELIREWWDEYKSFTIKDSRIYPIQYFKEPYQLLETLICRLYGEEGSTHFNMEWVPIMHYVVEVGHIFNWAQILSPTSLKLVREAPRLKKPSFYMSCIFN
jgi:hypothetical protein